MATPYYTNISNDANFPPLDQDVAWQRLTQLAAAYGLSPGADDLGGVVRNYYNSGPDGLSGGPRNLDAIFASFEDQYRRRGAPTQGRVADSQSALGNALYGSGSGNASNTPGAPLLPSTPAAAPASATGGVPMPGQQDAYGTVSTMGTEGMQGVPTNRYSGAPSSPTGTFANSPLQSGGASGFSASSSSGDLLTTLKSVSPFTWAALAAAAWFFYRHK